MDKDLADLLDNLGDILGQRAVDDIKKELVSVSTSDLEAIYQRIKKNLAYLTTIKQRGDGYHRALIAEFPDYLDRYASVLRWLEKHARRDSEELLPSLDVVHLQENVNTFILLGDAHVFGDEFVHALCSKVSLPELLIDIVHDAQNIIQGKDERRITYSNPKYENSPLIQYILGNTLIVQTGDNVYPTVIEHFILMSLKVLGKHFFTLAGDNDVFLVLNQKNLPHVSDRVASLIMKYAVKNQVSSRDSLLGLIQQEICARPTALLVEKNCEAIGISHAGIYDLSLNGKKDHKFISNQELKVTGIIDQSIGEKTTNKLLRKLSERLQSDVVGWFHGSESSSELRKISGVQEFNPGIFKLGSQRVWIADNKQDPKEKTQSLVLDFSQGIKSAFTFLLKPTSFLKAEH